MNDPEALVIGVGDKISITKPGHHRVGEEQENGGYKNPCAVHIMLCYLTGTKRDSASICQTSSLSDSLASSEKAATHIGMALGMSVGGFQYGHGIQHGHGSHNIGPVPS